MVSVVGFLMVSGCYRTVAVISKGCGRSAAQVAHRFQRGGIRKRGDPAPIIVLNVTVE